MLEQRVPFRKPDKDVGQRIVNQKTENKLENVIQKVELVRRRANEP